jgi:hypothetical protein
MRGESLYTTAKYVPSGENAQSSPELIGNVEGLLSLVNVFPERLYIVMHGELVCATAKYVPSGENAQPYPLLVGNVEGSSTFNDGIDGRMTTLSPLLISSKKMAFIISCPLIVMPPKPPRRDINASATISPPLFELATKLLVFLLRKML